MALAPQPPASAAAAAADAGHGGGWRAPAAAASTPAGFPPERGGGAIRDAEASVDFLCRKFQELSEQVRREEFAREASERHAAWLTAELRSAEESASASSSRQRRCAQAPRPPAAGPSLAALRASAGQASQRAAHQDERVREEEACGAEMEQLCTKLLEECRLEAARCDCMAHQLAAQDCGYMQEQCAQNEVGRRLRQTEADTRVSREDLRVAQQRALLIRSEHHSLEADLEAACRSCRSSWHEAETHGRQMSERRRQLHEVESRLEEFVQVAEAARAESLRVDKHLATFRDEDRSSHARLAALELELQAAQQEGQAWSSELRARAGLAAGLSEEIRAGESR
eukprot:CAMPEP_0175373988 /NCGR_PEP_ID=MMETSP0095-20121207/23016_1 /TAXON_ID=311494 /ORGANISM="Alexandrium monilatum, Strain CCMP3105" /LENGTH=341 /DNA_ID=CAMNT_0016672203 /DNA_START=9 /DNA_END=1031 /DNA_ORIENTATION=+